MVNTRERLKGKESEAMLKYISKPALTPESIRLIFTDMIEVDIAHAIMLGKTGIIGEDKAKAIVKGLIKLKEAGADNFHADTSRGDIHYNIEVVLIQELGMDVGGRMHTARSRNDLKGTCSKMRIRQLCLNNMKQLLAFRKTVIDLSKEHAETVMPAFTHSQPAQPITFGHYMSAMAKALERDFQRLHAAYKHINTCPLGAGAAAGIGFPIDRQYTSDLLGFDSLAEHSIDAIAARDYLVEYLAALANLLTLVSRIAQDLYTWNTFEFGFIEVADALAGTSSIMPQKKNPLTLEHAKSQAAKVYGELMAVLGCLKGAPYTHTSDVSTTDKGSFADNAAKAAEATMSLFGETLETLIVNTGQMLKDTRVNYCSATELADALTLNHNLAFREAHQIVGSLITTAIERNILADQITPELLAEASERITGKKVIMTKDELLKALDPAKCVETKTQIGSPAPSEVRRMLESCDKVLSQDQTICNEISSRLDAAAARLAAEAARYIG